MGSKRAKKFKNAYDQARKIFQQTKATTQVTGGGSLQALFTLGFSLGQLGHKDKANHVITSLAPSRAR